VATLGNSFTGIVRLSEHRLFRRKWWTTKIKIARIVMHVALRTPIAASRPLPRPWLDAQVAFDGQLVEVGINVRTSVTMFVVVVKTADERTDDEEDIEAREVAE
jgi:hypothetical protein